MRLYKILLGCFPLVVGISGIIGSTFTVFAFFEKKKEVDTNISVCTTTVVYHEVKEPRETIKITINEGLGTDARDRDAGKMPRKDPEGERENQLEKPPVRDTISSPKKKEFQESYEESVSKNITERENAFRERYRWLLN